MKTKKENRDEIRANSLTVPMSKDEKELVQRAANKMGVTMSAFARVAIKDYARKEMF
jgi:uncharacterized protein (DUF1778 family)